MKQSIEDKASCDGGTLMKRIRFVSTVVLLLLLGTVVPTYARLPQHEQEAKAPKQEQQAKPQAQPRQQPQRAQQQPRAQTKQQPQRAQQQPAKRPAQQPQQSFGGAYHGGVQSTGPTYGGVHHSGVPQQQGQVRSGFLQSRAKSWSTDHRTWQQRGGYNGYRIPDDRFNLYFGRDHFFRISGVPLLFVGGYPRFQYDGYWVTLVDPWPEDWPPTWYETDDVYLDYTGDGYYLYDRNYPGIGIAVTVSF